MSYDPDLYGPPERGNEDPEADRFAEPFFKAAREYDEAEDKEGPLFDEYRRCGDMHPRSLRQCVKRVHHDGTHEYWSDHD